MMDEMEILKELTAPAERFVQKAPKQQRLEADRQALPTMYGRGKN
jgi:hypothetical protein